jgi:hypothetical protein
MNLEVGDKVKVVCVDRSRFDSDPNATKVFVGTLKSIFNAFDKDGDSWHYEIAGESSGWFLYKPRIDGGTITLLQKGRK